MIQIGDPHLSHNLNLKKRVRFLSDFINLNKQLKRKTYPMPKYDNPVGVY